MAIAFLGLLSTPLPAPASGSTVTKVENVQKVKPFELKTDFNPELLKKFNDWVDTIDKTKPTELTIRINSPGGQVFVLSEMVARVRELKALGFTIRTINDGMAASCAFGFFLEGDIRVATTYSIFMSHSAAGGGQGQVEDFKSKLKLLELINDAMRTMIDRLSGQPGLGKKLIDDGTELWLGAKEMKAYNLVTEIIK